MSWVRRVLAHFGHASVVAKPPEHTSDERDRHSAELVQRADRVAADLRAVRRIEIVVRRR